MIQLCSKMLPQIEDTLNMLHTSRRDNKITAYEELHGPFDWNRTPLAPLGTKGMVFVTPGNRHTFAPHCDKAFVVGRAPHHYRLIEFFVPSSKGYRISGCYRLDPAHWSVPTISEQDKTVRAAAELITQLNAINPPAAVTKTKHIAIIQQLRDILATHPCDRIHAGPPRVGNVEH